MHIISSQRQTLFLLRDNTTIIYFVMTYLLIHNYIIVFSNKLRNTETNSLLMNYRHIHLIIILWETLLTVAYSMISGITEQ